MSYALIHQIGMPFLIFTGIKEGIEIPFPVRTVHLKQQ